MATRGLQNIVVVSTPLANKLVIGRIGKDPNLLLDSREAEKDIIVALTDHMMRDAPRGSIHEYTLNGRQYRLTLEPVDMIKEPPDRA